MPQERPLVEQSRVRRRGISGEDFTGAPTIARDTYTSLVAASLARDRERILSPYSDTRFDLSVDLIKKRKDFLSVLKGVPRKEIIHSLLDHKLVVNETKETSKNRKNKIDVLYHRINYFQDRYNSWLTEDLIKMCGANIELRNKIKERLLKFKNNIRNYGKKED